MIFIAVYILLTAISAVVDHEIGISIPNMLMIFLTTLYAILFFHVINYKTILDAYKKIWQMKKWFSIMLITIAIVWVGTFLIPIYYSPAIMTFTFMAFISFYGALVAYSHDKHFIDLLKAILVFIAIVSFFVIYFNDYPMSKYWIMVFATFVMGTAGYIYIHTTHHLHQFHFTATQILAMRYWLLLVIPFIFVIKDQQLLAVDMKVLSETFMLSFVMLIIPTFFLQKAIEKVGANLSATLMGLIPFVTFLLEKLIISTKTNAMGYLSIALAIAIILPYLLDLIIKKSLRRDIKSLIH